VRPSKHLFVHVLVWMFGDMNLTACSLLELTQLITSAKEVMFSLVFVCLCLCVSKITQKVMDGSF